jgi:hypothetical protein
MNIPDYDNPWDELRHLLSLVNANHLDHLAEDAHEEDAGNILAVHDPKKAADLLYEVTQAMQMLPRLHQQLISNPAVVARVAQIARRWREAMEDKPEPPTAA